MKTPTPQSSPPSYHQRRNLHLDNSSGCQTSNKCRHRPASLSSTRHIAQTTASTRISAKKPLKIKRAKSTKRPFHNSPASNPSWYRYHHAFKHAIVRRHALSVTKETKEATSNPDSRIWRYSPYRKPPAYALPENPNQGRNIPLLPALHVALPNFAGVLRNTHNEPTVFE